MAWFDLVWDYEAGGNVEHVAQHGLTVEDVQNAIFEAIDEAQSRSSDRRVFRGFALDGRPIVVVAEMLDAITIYPVTAYEIEE